MAEQAVRPSSSASSGPAGRWRTVDIVVTAVLGVAFGVVFWAWDVLYAAVEPAFAALPPLKGLLGGVWLLPAVVAALRTGASGVLRSARPESTSVLICRLATEMSTPACAARALQRWSPFRSSGTSRGQPKEGRSP